MLQNTKNLIPLNRVKRTKKLLKDLIIGIIILSSITIILLGVLFYKEVILKENKKKNNTELISKKDFFKTSTYYITPTIEMIKFEVDGKFFAIFKIYNDYSKTQMSTEFVNLTPENVTQPIDSVFSVSGSPITISGTLNTKNK